MRKFRASLFLRVFSVLFLVGAACLFGGAAFSPAGLNLLIPQDLAGSGFKVEPREVSPSGHTVPLSHSRNAVLARLNEMMLTERAVSVSV